ncbi:MAG: NADH-quinone oxidoreductase subunit C [Nitrospinae bacterium]|nr:NADH-quinone oxidoreductase subunit C [Nitrospinota bacterium]
MKTLSELLIIEGALKDNSQRGIDAFTISRERFIHAAQAIKAAKGRLAAQWGVDEAPFGRGFVLCCVFCLGNEYVLARLELEKEAPAFFPSLARIFIPAWRFERQIMSLMGLTAEGHPDARPWIKFEDWPKDAYPLRKSFDGTHPLQRASGEYHWIKTKGEGAYEIPVGPVHAGIIEPGHFRFQAVGEAVLNLEERLGYAHKGIEKCFESLSWEEGARLAGRISGDTTVAHALAYSQAVESASGLEPPERASWLRALFLERERIANHLGDIGAICNDVAFAFMYYQMGRLREIVLRANKALFGHRLLMDKVRPGGVSADMDSEARRAILSEMEGLSREFERLVRIYDDHPSLGDRLYDTGVFSPAQAEEFGVVGIVARASGQKMDARLRRPFPPYHKLVPRVPVLHSGDAHARAWVRVEEIRESICFIQDIVKSLPEGGIEIPCPAPLPDAKGFAAVEGWRGEIITWVQAGPDGKINRCMVRDPSSVNWLGLEQAAKGNMVPDFPLCNKSFNQSYSGHDL